MQCCDDGYWSRPVTAPQHVLASQPDRYASRELAKLPEMHISQRYAANMRSQLCHVDVARGRACNTEGSTSRGKVGSFFLHHATPRTQNVPQ